MAVKEKKSKVENDSTNTNTNNTNTNTNNNGFLSEFNRLSLSSKLILLIGIGMVIVGILIGFGVIEKDAILPSVILPAKVEEVETEMKYFAEPETERKDFAEPETKRKYFAEP